MRHFNYDADKSAEVVFNFLPKAVRRDIIIEEITLMLALYYTFLINSAIERLNPNQSRLEPRPGIAENYIIRKCAKEGVHFSYKDVKYILDVEFFLCCQVGTVRLNPKHFKLGKRKELGLKIFKR